MCIDALTVVLNGWPSRNPEYQTRAGNRDALIFDSPRELIMSASATRHDVLVVGGGLAGLVAASRAAELGAEVLLLEKGGFLGDGNTLMTTGAYFTAGISQNSPPDELNNRAVTRGAAYPELAR